MGMIWDSRGGARCLKTNERTLWQRIYLAEINASSLAASEVPEDWRFTDIVPFFQKGCNEKTENYRPVS